jgi:hypothetical protein
VADPSSQQTFRELKDLVVAYLRQETLDPLRNLGRFLGFGLAGGLLLGIGAACAAVGGLRAMQTETGTAFTGNWSWAPYAIVAVGLVGIGAATWRLRRRDGAR